MNAPPSGQARLAIVGATGMVGGYALRDALDHPAVGTVMAIGRRTLGIQHPKLREVLHGDFADCSALADALSGQDAAVFCLGAYMHLAAELAQAAKAIGPGRPVKLVWTREDDIRGGYYRPLFLHRLRGAVSGGKIVAWADSIVGQSILKGTPFESIIKNGIDPYSVEGARDIPYDIADFRCELHTTDAAVPVLSWRSVGHTHTGSAVECFVDELLQAAGKDPVAGRLEMMSKSPRAEGALRAVAELAGWSGPGPVDKRARGVAVVECFGTWVAQIAEVSLGNGGRPRVRKVWCAVDCGVAVNPDVIRAQMEGGIGFGLGHVLFAEVTVERGRPLQGNFDTYRSLRIDEMPEIEVVIVASAEKPTGVGEPATPVIAPALANAILALSGKPVRALPLSAQGITFS